VAPTISNYLGVSPPSGSTGTPLPYITVQNSKEPGNQEK
jgi:hypothetical protein